MRFLFLFLALIIVWVLVDFRLGRRRQLSRVTHRKLPLRHSNFQLYTSGSKLYKQLFTDIQHAAHHIHILFFIVKNDEVSHSFLNLLMEKAQQGIEVRLLVDRIGSNHLSKKTIRRLQESGIHFSFCHSISPPFLFYSINERNHRKISIIDGTIGYIGGFNIGEEYLGHGSLGKWRDYHLRIVGEGVNDLQEQFLHDWREETNEHFMQNTTYFPQVNRGNSLHQFIPTDGAYLQKTFLELIERAKHTLFIGTPYFIPGRILQQALLRAAKRGVHIMILVPEKADHPLVREARLPYFRRLLDAGCHLYLFTDGFYHAKIVLVDDAICDIGTANFDLRSLYLNHEMNCLIYDKAFITIIKKECEQDMHHSRLLTLEELNALPLLTRCKEWIATIISLFL